MGSSAAGPALTMRSTPPDRLDMRRRVAMVVLALVAGCAGGGPAPEASTPRRVENRSWRVGIPPGFQPASEVKNLEAVLGGLSLGSVADAYADASAYLHVRDEQLTHLLYFDAHHVQGVCERQRRLREVADEVGDERLPDAAHRGRTWMVTASKDDDFILQRYEHCEDDYAWRATIGSPAVQAELARELMGAILDEATLKRELAFKPLDR